MVRTTLERPTLSDTTFGLRSYSLRFAEKPDQSDNCSLTARKSVQDLMLNRSSSPDHIREISAVLARAFVDDPFYTYIMPKEGTRLSQLGWWMTCMTRYGLEYGQVHTTPEKMTGAAIWLKPERPLVDSMRMARMGLIRAPLQLGIRGFVRMMKTANEWEHLHQQEASRHWYLMILGVDPTAQGQGIGGSLMRPVFEEADQMGVPCYLETMTTENVAFYRKHGFDIVVEGTVGPKLPYWTMRRLPRLQQND